MKRDVNQFASNWCILDNAKWTEPSFECTSTETHFDNLISGTHFTYNFFGMLQLRRNMVIAGRNLRSPHGLNIDWTENASFCAHVTFRAGFTNRLIWDFSY